MKLGLLLLIISLLSPIAHATDCSVFLSAPESNQTQVYIGLVNHYIKRTGGVGSSGLLNSIIKAEKPIDPFASLTGSREVQLSDAIKTFYSKLSQHDWTEIREAAKALLKESNTQQEDRSIKKEDLKLLFAPKIVATKQINEDMINGAEWLVVRDAIYISVANGSHIILYRFKNDKLEELDRVSLEHDITSNPTWQVVGDRVLLTFKLHDIVKRKFPLFVYEVKKDKLKKVAQLKDSAGQSELRTIGGRVYLITFIDKMLKLHELEKNKLNEVQSIDFKSVSSSWRWQVLGDKTYFSITNFFGYFSKDIVYEFDEKSGQLVQLAEQTDTLVIDAQVRYLQQLVGERIISPNGVFQPVYWKQFEFLELKNKKLVKRSVRLADGRSSFEGTGSLITASNGGTSYILELDDGGLRMTDFIEGGSTAGDTPTKYNNEHFVVRLEEGSMLYFYDIQNGMFRRRAGIKVDETIRPASLRWMQMGDELFLLYHGEYEFGVIKIFNSASAR